MKAKALFENILPIDINVDPVSPNTFYVPIQLVVRIYTMDPDLRSQAQGNTYTVEQFGRN